MDYFQHCMHALPEFSSHFMHFHLCLSYIHVSNSGLKFLFLCNVNLELSFTPSFSCDKIHPHLEVTTLIEKQW